MNPYKLIDLALDVESLKAAVPFVELFPLVGRVKINEELCNAEGLPVVLKFVQDNGGEIFLDTKIFDTDFSVRKAVKSALSHGGVGMFNVAAAAGPGALCAAAENKGSAIALAVTVLTTMDEEECIATYGGTVAEVVVRFADLALVANVDGLICSARDLPVLNEHERFAKMSKVTPGIRPAGAAHKAQKRVMTPGDAIKMGVTEMVIGSPITQPESGTPLDALHAIAEEAGNAL